MKKYRERDKTAACWGFTGCVLSGLCIDGMTGLDLSAGVSAAAWWWMRTKVPLAVSNPCRVTAQGRGCWLGV